MSNCIASCEAKAAHSCASEEQHRTDESAYWGRQIYVAKWLNWITASAGGIAIIGLIFVAIGLSDNRAATVAANRAWLAAEWRGVKTNAPNIIFEIRLLNVGKEPAIDINFADPTISFVDLHDGSDVDWPSANACKTVQPTPQGMVVYPAPAEGKTQILASRIKPEMANGFSGVLAGNKAILIVGCIAYATFRETHYTQYCFLEKKMPDNSIVGSECKRGGWAD